MNKIYKAEVFQDELQTGYDTTQETARGARKEVTNPLFETPKRPEGWWSQFKSKFTRKGRQR